MRISVLIPCHNEERSIYACIYSCLRQTRSVDEIIVVDDGSTDASRKMMDIFGDRIKVVSTGVATGNKSRAQEAGIPYVTGDIVIATDADTILDERFVEYVEKDFQDQKVMAVSGYVKGIPYNWLTACREIDYALSQNIHKRAQSHINFLAIIPGCAAAYRTSLFRDVIVFDHDTLTEDLDITYQLHEKGLRMLFNRQAIVHTQDPSDIRSYWRQMRRWYAGGWQNLVKHRKLMKSPVAGFELSLLYLEGIVLPFILLILPFLNVAYFLQYILAYVFMAHVIALFAAIVNKRPSLLLYAFPYLFIVAINAFLFIREFIAEVIFRQQKMVWLRADRRGVSL